MTDQQEPPEGSGDPFDPYSNLEDLTGGETLPPLEDPSVPPAQPPRSPILTGLIVALLLIVLSISIFQLLREDEAVPTDPAPVAAVTTTEAAPTVTAAPDTTPIPTGAPATTVGVEVPGTFDPYVAVGEPIPLDELRMAVDGIGPIKFGVSASEAVGRLISSLGEPTEDTGPRASTGVFGVCEEELERIVYWGPFVAIVAVDPDGTETFAAYRIDFSYGDVDHQATNLKTLSGLRVLQSVVAFKEIYENFAVAFEVEPDLGTTFKLRRPNTGDLLLWGPVTSDDPDGKVLGIYSPDACGRL